MTIFVDKKRIYIDTVNRGKYNDRGEITAKKNNERMVSPEISG
jgi:hypothetical protein